jgi:hypothetical protein
MKPSYKDILPEYPSTRHLPWKPNNKGDKVATEAEASVIFSSALVAVQEKIDGANCGMGYLDGHPVVRSRSKILRKGQDLKNPSQAQFASAWNWMHKNAGRFQRLDSYGPYSVYGEWMIQQHGMAYDNLPDWFIAYDLYDWEKGLYLDPQKADTILREIGFDVIPLSFYGDPRPQKPLTYEFLEEVANCPSWFTKNSQREGIVVKVSDGDYVTHKFKMVRQGFDQGCLLGKTISKNSLRN